MFSTLGSQYMMQQHDLAVCCADRKAQLRTAQRERRAPRRAKPAAAVGQRCC